MKIRKNRSLIFVFIFFAVSFATFSKPTAERLLPDYYNPGQPIRVELKIDPGKDALAWVVEESPPAGWKISRIENEGVMDTLNQKVKWGLFLDNKSRDLSYTIIPSQNENTMAVFSGLISVNGKSFDIEGIKILEWGLKRLLNHFLGIPGGMPIDPNYDNQCDIGDILYFLNHRGEK